MPCGRSGNRASVAHPNEDLLAEPEVMLIISVRHTLLNYLNAKQLRQQAAHRSNKTRPQVSYLPVVS